MKKVLIVIVVLVVLAGLVGAGGFVAMNARGGFGNQFGQNQENATEVILREATLGELSKTVSAPGSIEPRTNVEISAQVSARIVALPFREGENVQEGDVVVRLDARDLAAALSSAQAQLRSEEARLDGAKADFLRAQAEYGRIQELFDTRDVSRSDLDIAEADFLSARSRLGQAEQSIEIAKATITQREKDLDNAIIRSPTDGTIIRLAAEVGETVIVGTTNNPGSIIMEIADLSVMLLRAQVDESNIAPVEHGQPASVYVNAYPEATFTGRVERVGLKRQVGSDGVGFFDTEVLIEPGEDDPVLRSGLTANTEIRVETLYDVVKVPSQAVVDRRSDELPKEVLDASPHATLDDTFARVVYVLGDDGKVEARPVRTGPSDLSETVIVAGLEAGERVVAGPFRVLVELRHEQAVKDRDAEPAEGPASDENGADQSGAVETETDENSGGAS